MKNIINIAFIFVLLLALGSCDKECISPNQEDTTKYNDMNNFDGDEHSINNQTRGGEGNYKELLFVTCF